MDKKIIWNQPQRIADFVAGQLGLPMVSEAVAAIGLEASSGELLAGVLFDNYNGASICMHVAAVPGKRWMTRDYLRASFAYPFLQLKVRKLLGLVSSANVVAQKFDEHLGFVLETALKDAHPNGDLLVYSMTREQCRWINIPLRKSPHGQELAAATA
jgi:RimJ/RimL family protein N-acetyltransferase